VGAVGALALVKVGLISLRWIVRQLLFIFFSEKKENPRHELRGVRKEVPTRFV
jgi:hypothetical protein